MGDKNTQEWRLEPETEYRFELEPEQTLAVKVRPNGLWRTYKLPLAELSLPLSFSTARPRFLVQS